MPIIVVRNWPSEVEILPSIYLKIESAFILLLEAHSRDNNFKSKLSDALRLAVVEAKIAGIDGEESVTVSFDAGHSPPVSKFKTLPDDKTLCITVEKLFARNDRNQTDRERLAENLKEAAMSCLPSGWEVEVFVERPFNPLNDTFCTSKKA